MPLLDGRKFIKQPPPANLDPNEEVFFCPVTLEIFRSYDHYFDRTILINSVNWSCSSCGRGPSTYANATACERADNRALKSFDLGLAAGFLHIITGSQRQRLADLLELIFEFVASRLFIGELVTFSSVNFSSTKTGVVKNVVLQTPQARFQNKPTIPHVSNNNQQMAANSKQIPMYHGPVHPKQSETPLSRIPKVNHLYYHVAEIDSSEFKPDEAFITANATMATDKSLLLLPASRVERKSPESVGRDRIKFFIRQTCELHRSFFVPKSAALKRFHLPPYGQLTWDTVYSLPQPDWVKIFPPLPGFDTKRTGPAPTNHGIYQKYTPTATNPTINKRVEASYRVVDVSNQSNSSRVMVVKPSTTTNSSTTTTPSTVVKATGRDVASSSLGNKSAATLVTPTPTTNNTNTNDAISNFRSLHAARVELEREWIVRRPREDLELPDLVAMLDYQEFQTRLPSSVVGSALQMFEFLRLFGSQLNLVVARRRSNQTNRQAIQVDRLDQLSWPWLESCLIDSDPLSPLADLLMTLLTTLRRLESESHIKSDPPNLLVSQQAVASIVANATANQAAANHHHHRLNGRYDNSIDLLPLQQALANTASACSQAELLGITLNSALTYASSKATASAAASDDTSSSSLLDQRSAALQIALGASSLVPLNRSTLAKALALHLTTSGARPSPGWRSTLKGLCRLADDPGFGFCRLYPKLVNKLNSTSSLYTLSSNERLLVINCLLDELLLYPSCRDRIDACCAQLRLHRASLYPTTSNFKGIGGGLNFTVTPSESHPKHDDPSAAASDSESVDHRPTAASSDTESEESSSKVKPPVAKSEGQPTSTTESATVNEGPNFVTDYVNPLINLEKTNFWERLLALSYTCSLLPLGQDRFYRRYWLLLTHPCLLVEPPSLTNENKDLDMDDLVLRKVQLGSVDQSLATLLCLDSPAKAAQRLRRLMGPVNHLLTGPGRVSALVGISNRLTGIVSNSNIDTCLRQLTALVRPSAMASSLSQQPATSEDDASTNNSPAYQQSLSFQHRRRQAHGSDEVWRVVLPSTDEDPCDDLAAASVKDLDDDQLWRQRATWTLDCLEASLNPRGVREGHLRRSLAQLRDLVIQVLVVSGRKHFDEKTKVSEGETKVKEESHPDSITESSSQSKEKESSNFTTLLPSVPSTCKEVEKKDKETSHLNLASLSLAWFELGLLRMATRLGLATDLIDLATDLVQLSHQQEEEEASVSSTIKQDRYHSRLEKARQALLALGNRIGPNSLAGPLSHSDRTIHLTTTTNTSTDTAGGSRRSSTNATTGWERWCLAVNATTSISELHLLALALERAARRAQDGGRGVSAQIQQNSIPLPPLVCTGCHRQCTKNQSSTNDFGTGLAPSPFDPMSICATCSAPYHPACLLFAADRRHRLSQHPTLECRRLLGYHSPVSPLRSSVVARQLTNTCASQLCQQCLTLANSGSDDGQVSVVWRRQLASMQPAPKPKSVVTGDTSSSNRSESPNRRRSSRLAGPRSFKRAHGYLSDSPSSIDSPIALTDANNNRDVGINSYSPVLCPSPIKEEEEPRSITKRRGRKRRRSSSSSEDNKPASRPRKCITLSGPGLTDPVGIDVSTDCNNQVFFNSTEESQPLIKKATILLDPVDDDLVKLHQGHVTNGPITSQSDCLDQTSLERLLSDLCDLPVARPLLRCGAGARSAEAASSPASSSTGTDDSGPRQQKRRSSRKCSLPLRLRSSPPSGFNSHQHDVDDDESQSEDRSETASSSSNLCVHDLVDLRDRVESRTLLGGPKEALTQLRLLIDQWKKINRPGSRLHQCAVTLGDQLNNRLAALQSSSHNHPQ